MFDLFASVQLLKSIQMSELDEFKIGNFRCIPNIIQ